MTNPPLVFFTFAGRTANMEIQRPHVMALLDQNPGAEFHLWDMTREQADQEYIRRWAASDDRIVYVGHLHPGHPYACLGPRRRGHFPCRCIKHKPPFEEPYRWYRDKADRYRDTTFVKFDDDVIWMDVPQFPRVLEFLETHPAAVASANVTNNAVCAKYEPRLDRDVQKAFGIGDTTRDFDHDWWRLHMSSHFAWLSHRWLTQNLHDGVTYAPPAFRTREGEKVSINFIAMKWGTLCLAASAMGENRYGDEGTIDDMLPWIVPAFRVAHLTFGPQETEMDAEEIDTLRDLYRDRTDYTNHTEQEN